MWRAFFLAIGVSLVILGAEFMAIDQVVLYQPPAEGGALHTLTSITSTRVVGPTVLAPPEWAPWCLFSVGAVVMIYSFTIPKRVRD